MVNLFRAEWRKITGNRRATGLILLIFPIGTFILSLITLVIALLSEQFRQVVVQSPPQWDQQLLSPWGLVNSEFGRFIVVAFAAILFGGEYSWGTWKNTLQYRPRSTLILIKFLAVAAFVVVTFVGMSLISWFMVGLVTAVSGASYGPPATGEVISSFIGTYLLQAGTAFMLALISSAYTALTAILTHSIIGSLITGEIVTLLETLLLAGLALLSVIFQNPSLVNGYLLTPDYNLANLSSWISTGRGYELNMVGATIGPLTLPASAAIVAAWIVGLIGLTLYAFRRQDINS